MRIAKGSDSMAGILVTAHFLFIGLPALLLAWREKPRQALTLAFPAALVILFVAAMIAFACFLSADDDLQHLAQPIDYILHTPVSGTQ